MFKVTAGLLTRMTHTHNTYADRHKHTNKKDLLKNAFVTAIFVLFLLMTHISLLPCYYLHYLKLISEPL